MYNIDQFLRAEMEPLQYAVFFGALALLALAELFASTSTKPPSRLRRWPVNSGLTVLNIAIIGALPVSGVLVADYAVANGYGLLNIVGAAPVTALIIGFLLRSFVSWAIHFSMHKVPLLWRVHRIHHTDAFLDVSTTVRFHPVEFLVNTPVLLASILAMGVSTVTLMLYELFDAAMAVLTHANVRLPRRFERVMRLLLVTPDMHRVHHSTLQQETDSNYGATLSIWDHLFGTYCDKPSKELRTMRLGLAECQDDRASSLWWLLSLPFRPLRIAEKGNVNRNELRPAATKAERT